MVSFSKSGSSLRKELEAVKSKSCVLWHRTSGLPIPPLLPRGHGERGYKLSRLDHLQVTKLQDPKFPTPETHKIETFQLKYIFLSFCFATTLLPNSGSYVLLTHIKNKTKNLSQLFQTVHGFGILIYSEIQIPQSVFTLLLSCLPQSAREGCGGWLSYQPPSFRPSSVSLVVPLYI